MLRRITLENFMSHGHTVIDLPPGLTVLTGPNNCGKSAVVAALQIVASNGRTKHVLRHGAKRCRVTVETDDGHTIVWERSKSAVKYTIDGEEVHRVGSGVPEALHRTLRLNRVEAETGKTTHEYDIHFGEQKSPVFLLGETGSRAASFFASSSDASRLVEMQHRHRSRVRDQQQEAKRLSAELDRIDRRLASYEPVDPLERRIEQAERQHEALAATQRRLTAARELIENLQRLHDRLLALRSQRVVLERLERAKTDPHRLAEDAREAKRLGHHALRLTQIHQDLNRWRRCRRALASLATPPDQQPVEQVRQAIKKISATQHAARAAQVQCQACDGLRPPPELAPTEPTAERLRQLRAASRLRAVWRARVSKLDPLTSPPEIRPTVELHRLVGRLEALQRQRREYQRHHRRLGSLRPPVELDNPEPLRSTITGLTRTEKTLSEARERSAAAERAAAACADQIRCFVEDHPQCEVCGAAIDAERLLSAAPSSHDHVIGGGKR